MTARSKNRSGDGDEGVISLVGPEMRVTGDLHTDGTVRIEGQVRGNVRAEKAVVVGKEGKVDGDVMTQDAIVSGRVHGSLTAASRLEVQATAHVDGDVRARRLQLEEGAMLNGTVEMSEDVSLESARPAAPEGASAGSVPAGSDGAEGAPSPAGPRR